VITKYSLILIGEGSICFLLLRQLVGTRRENARTELPDEYVEIELNCIIGGPYPMVD